jgi:DNA repair protein RadC
MGVFISTSQRRRPLRQGVGAAVAADCLRVDEECADLGRSTAAGWRNHGQSPAAALNRQQLLADLIGGESRAAERQAAKLISAFGSVSSVLAAPSSALARLTDDPGLANRLAAAKALVIDSLGEQLSRERFDLSNRLVQLWVISLFKERRTERVHLALLDHQKRLLWEERVCEGNLNSVGLNLRKVVSRGIDVGASAVVLMHNHPSGDPQPSVGDIDETRRIASLLTHLDMHLHDHLIVADNRIFSMQAAKLI